MQSRPSPKERNKKVRDGLEAVRNDRRRVAVEKHLAQAFDFLGVGTAEELWAQIEPLLSELNEIGAAKSYCGKSPPEKSYDIPNEELWPYVWDSEKLGKRVYLKFVMKKGYFLLVDCHESEEIE